MPDREFQLPAAADGQIPVVHVWEASGDDRNAAGAAQGVVLVAHGMGEHALRYEPLARVLNAAGFVVFAQDHRGHGRTAGDPARLGDFGPEGWQGLVDDQLRLIRRAREEHGGPVLLLGHSMGSMVVQHVLTEASEALDGAALSGTTAVDVMAAATEAAAEAEANGDGEGGDLFARFNAAFEPVRTASDWLSRDPEQVDRYVADPLCGFTTDPASFASLTRAGRAFSSEAATARIRKDLPIYVFAGDADPVGANGQLVTLVAERYRAAGIQDVRLTLYPGARHEVLNETNRDRVAADFRDWAVGVRERAAPQAARRGAGS